MSFLLVNVFLCCKDARDVIKLVDDDSSRVYLPSYPNVLKTNLPEPLFQNIIFSNMIAFTVSFFSLHSNLRSK